MHMLTRAYLTAAHKTIARLLSMKTVSLKPKKHYQYIFFYLFLSPGAQRVKVISRYTTSARAASIQDLAEVARESENPKQQSTRKK